MMWLVVELQSLGLSVELLHDDSDLADLEDDTDNILEGEPTLEVFEGLDGLGDPSETIIEDD